MISLWTLGARLAGAARRLVGLAVERAWDDAGGGGAEPPPAGSRDPGAELRAAMALSADMHTYLPGWYCPRERNDAPRGEADPGVRP
jgi:hypothetical protein